MDRVRGAVQEGVTVEVLMAGNNDIGYSNDRVTIQFLSRHQRHVHVIVTNNKFVRFLALIRVTYQVGMLLLGISSRNLCTQ